MVYFWVFILFMVSAEAKFQNIANKTNNAATEQPKKSEKLGKNLREAKKKKKLEQDNKCKNPDNNN